MSALLAFAGLPIVARAGVDLLAQGTLKGSATVLIAAAGALALRRSSSAIRHLVWTAGIVGLLIVVPLSILLPAWQVALPEALAPLAGFVRRGTQRCRRVRQRGRTRARRDEHWPGADHSHARA